MTLTRTDARTNEGELGRGVRGGGRRGSFAGTYFGRLVLFSSTLRVCQRSSVDTSPPSCGPGACLSSRGSTIVPRLTYSVSARVFARQIRKRSAIDYSRPNRETNTLCVGLFRTLGRELNAPLRIASLIRYKFPGRSLTRVGRGKSLWFLPLCSCQFYKTSKKKKRKKSRRSVTQTV